MPIKPLTHLRPLLRLPTSHQSSPDHFSSNPSLLHHLSSNQNQGLTLGGQHAPSSGGSSGSSGAGKAGWGNSGAGAGGGGYTGHGRAFLSLPHTGIVDPSSSFTSSTSDEQQRKSSARSALLLKHRLSKQVRVVNLDQGRAVHRQIESRTGSRLGVIDLEDSPPLREHRALLDVDDIGEPGPSITFPSQPSTPRTRHSPLPRVLSPSTPHSRSPSTRSSLHRSTSSLDLWQVVPRQLSLRSISSAAASTLAEDPEHGLGLSEPLPIDAITITRSSPRRPIPPLTDLAGVDLPIHQRHDRVFVRRNSTAYMPQTQVDDPVILEPIRPDSVPSYDAFLSRLEDKTATDAQIEELVAYYRAPRGVDSQSQLHAALPLPKTYQTSVYNACLKRLLRIRQPGQSIAGVVEIYNEMLTRDCRPNRATYNFLIEAFALREQDVWKAINQWDTTRARTKWWDTTLGSQSQAEPTYEAQDQLANGYRSEANLANAFKLVRAIRLSAPPPSGRNPSTTLTTETEQQLLQACVVGHIAPDELQLLKDIYLERSGDLHYGRAQRLMAVLSQAKDGQGLSDLWTTVQAQDASMSLLRSNVRAARLVAFAQAASSFYTIGDVEKGDEVMQVIYGCIERGEIGDVSEIGPSLGSLLTVLVNLDRIDHAVDIHSTMAEMATKVNPAALRPIHPAYYRDLVDALVIKGHWRVAWSLIQPLCGRRNTGNKTAAHGFVDPRSMTRLYAAILAEASAKTEQDTELDELLTLLHTISRDTKPLEFRGELYEIHSDLLCRFGRYSAIPEIDRNFIPYTGQNPKILDFLLPAVSQAIRAEDVPLSEVLSVWRHYHVVWLRDGRRRPTQLTQEDALGLGQKYLDARKKVSGAQELGLPPLHYMDIARALIYYPEDEPEIDEALLQLSEDLGASTTSSEDVDQIVRSSTTRPLVERLFHRFGEERANQLVVTAYGSDRGQELIAIYDRSKPRAVPPLDLSGSVENDIPAPPVDTSHAGPPDTPRGRFILPPPPDYFASIPPLSPSLLTKPPPRVSDSLTERIEGELERVIRSRQMPNRRRLFAMVAEQLNQYYVVPSVQTLSKLIDQLCRVDHNDNGAKHEAEQHVRQLYALGYLVVQSQKASPRGQWQNLENAMLIGLCNLGQLVQAGLHRSRLLSSGVTPSADAYATMIASAKDTTDDAVVATQLWEECKAYGVRPNLYLYNTIISKLSKARKAEMALALFVEMKEKRVQPSSVTYGAVINACCRVGDGQSAATLFNEMAAQRNFKPRVPPFNTMMQFHLTTSPNRDAVLHYFNTLVSTGCPPSAHTYKLLLDAYAVLQPLDLESFERVFAELVADPRVTVQGTHWASLISAHGLYASNYSKALEIFRTIPSHPTASVDLASEPVIWEAILNVISQKSTVENLEAMHREMVELGAQATAYVYNILIAGYARAGQIDNARSVFNSMGDSVSGVAAPNNHPTLLTSSGHVKPSTITEGPTSVVYREPSTYEAMIRAELAYGTKENAQSVLGMMQERRYPVAVYMRAENLISDHALAEGTRPNAEIMAPGVFVPSVSLNPVQDLQYASPKKSSASLARDPVAEAYTGGVEPEPTFSSSETPESTGDIADSVPTDPSSSGDSASSPPTSATNETTHEDDPISKEQA